MAKIRGVILVPIQIINIFGGVVSFIWLAVLGDWSPLLYGIVLSVVATQFLLTLLGLPALGLGLIAAALLDKGWRVSAVPFLFLGKLYTCALMAAWCIVVYAFFLKDSTDQTNLPLLIWSYGVATGPWTYMAAWILRSGGSPPAIVVVFLQIAYLVVTIITWRWGITLGGATTILSGAMALAAIIDGGATAASFLRGAASVGQPPID
jgi:hypothetical protein